MYKLLTFILLFIQLNLIDAQTIEDVKNKYQTIHKVSYKVSSFFHMPDVSRIGKQEHFYQIENKKKNQEIKWFDYDIYSLDTFYYSSLRVYKCSDKIQYIHLKDTFYENFRLKHWDTIYYCTDNPPAFNGFVHYQPFVSCFFPTKSKALKKKVSIAKNGVKYFELINKYTGMQLKVFINSNLLIDSIHIKTFKRKIDRVYFEYYKINDVEINAAPYFYPLSVENKSIYNLRDNAVKKKLLTPTDSSKIELFKTQTEKYQLLDFWFIGCKPCQKNFPQLQELQSKFSNNLDVIALNPIDKESDIKKFKEKYKFNFDMQTDSLSLKDYYDVTVFPTTILINSNGEVLYKHIGYDPLLFDKIYALLIQKD
ncbi:MAG: TlpA disulfide reductase family protein [Bacteroidota bacterium]|nr:TlpA disulfide reductase family protein [Bacteroidota bacterium]